MKEEVKTRWVAALRSGDYEQGIGRLCALGKFCCLGVLCEVLGVPKTAPSLRDAQIAYGLDLRVSVLPEHAVALAGMTSNSGLYGRPPGDYEALTCDNDRGKTFAQIADTIEAHWQQL